jgi:hypothetical protein
LGLNIDRDHLEEDDYARFSQRLREDMRALAELLSRERFGVGAPSLGAELEMSMVGATCHPRPINERVLADTCDPRFMVELNRFNLECNTLPVALARTPFSSRQATRRVSDAPARHRQHAPASQERTAMPRPCELARSVTAPGLSTGVPSADVLVAGKGGTPGRTLLRAGEDDGLGLDHPSHLEVRDRCSRCQCGSSFRLQNPTLVRLILGAVAYLLLFGEPPGADPNAMVVWELWG